MFYKSYFVNTEGKFRIVEEKTGNIMYEDLSLNSATLLVNELNRERKGFCGWTPRFILQDVSSK